MCGRTTATVPRETLGRVLEVDEIRAPELPLSWNVAPTQAVYAALSTSAGCRVLGALRWGLVPSWAEDLRIGARLINARAETVGQKPAFRAALAARRALLPVSGFYEWRRAPAGVKVPRQPFFFRRGDGQALVLAGLWATWRSDDGELVRSCSIITTTANQTMAPVHHRMPVVLPPEYWREWLQPRPLPPGRLGQLLVPAAEDLLVAHPVGPAVNNANNDGPDLVAPVPLVPLPAAMRLDGIG